MAVYTNRIQASSASQVLLPARTSRKAFVVRNQCRDMDMLVNLDHAASRDAFITKIPPDAEWVPPNGFVFTGTIHVAWDCGDPAADPPETAFAIGTEIF